MKGPEMEQTLREARRTLLAQRNGAGHWEGRLSTSALSTATAVVALSLWDRRVFSGAIAAGCAWLARHQNEDGGWGDTDRSRSNLSTTLLCWSALALANPGEGGAGARAERWIASRAGGTDARTLVAKVTERYGKDRTFAVPILMTCAICGKLGEARSAWRQVFPLPFELSVLPRCWFAALQLPVVSYALPALISIGYARNVHAPPPLWGALRRWAWPKASRLLERMQPSSGGFLEATPLTSFVMMALLSAGQRTHPVVRRGAEFLRRSQREDGGWPIDTNLATWVTTLAIKALLAEGSGAEDLSEPDRESLRNWLLAQQYREEHPFTGAAPGGWAWTDLPGGVPDGDDTPGALLALSRLSPEPVRDEVREAVERGIRWLLSLQNRDGGIPTFCRGWGALPFDRSSPDLTAHALRAWNAWRETISPQLRARMDRAAGNALRYLARVREPAGCWAPLWFGNQDEADESNRTYGTAQVLLALAEIESWMPHCRELRRGAEQWLMERQQEDGGWGGGDALAASSLEETAVALEALALAPPSEARRGALARGVAFLVDRTKGGREFPEAPIGFYFAKLWYYERLYPQVWTVGALQRLAGRPD